MVVYLLENPTFGGRGVRYRVTVRKKKYAATGNTVTYAATSRTVIHAATFQSPNVVASPLACVRRTLLHSQAKPRQESRIGVLADGLVRVSDTQGTFNFELRVKSTGFFGAFSSVDLVGKIGRSHNLKV